METLPALRPEAPAFFNPFFLTIKLAPINKLEDNANTNPFMLSVDIPISVFAITLQSLHHQHQNDDDNNNNVSPQNSLFPFHIIHQVVFFILILSKSDCITQMCMKNEREKGTAKSIGICEFNVVKMFFISL